MWSVDDRMTEDCEMDRGCWACGPRVRPVCQFEGAHHLMIRHLSGAVCLVPTLLAQFRRNCLATVVAALLLLLLRRTRSSKFRESATGELLCSNPAAQPGAASRGTSPTGEDFPPASTCGAPKITLSSPAGERPSGGASKITETERRLRQKSS